MTPRHHRRRAVSGGLAAVVVAVLVPSLPALAAAGSAERGATIFKQRCGTCHNVTGAKSLQGPNLSGVVGRRAAARSDYNYSKALLGSGLTWTAENLDAYLTAPTAVVRGTRMMAKVPQAADRADIIAYLASTR